MRKKIFILIIIIVIAAIGFTGCNIKTETSSKSQSNSSIIQTNSITSQSAILNKDFVVSKDYKSEILNIPLEIDSAKLVVIKWLDDTNLLLIFYTKNDTDETAPTKPIYYLYNVNTHIMEFLYNGKQENPSSYIYILKKDNKFAVVNKNYIIIFENKKCIFEKEYSDYKVYLSPDFKYLVKRIMNFGLVICDFTSENEIGRIETDYTTMSSLNFSNSCESFIYSNSYDLSGAGFTVYNIKDKQSTFYEYNYYGSCLDQISWSSDDKNIIINIDDNSKPDGDSVNNCLFINTVDKSIKSIYNFMVYNEVAIKYPYLSYINSSNNQFCVETYDIETKRKEIISTDFYGFHYLDMNNSNDIIVKSITDANFTEEIIILYSKK